MIERSDGSFQLSVNTHNPPADPGAAVCAAITATVKTIIEEVLLDQMTAGPNDRWTLLKSTQTRVYCPCCQQKAPTAMTERPAEPLLRAGGKLPLREMLNMRRCNEALYIVHTERYTVV